MDELLDLSGLNLGKKWKKKNPKNNYKKKKLKKRVGFCKVKLYTVFILLFKYKYLNINFLLLTKRFISLTFFNVTFYGIYSCFIFDFFFFFSY